MAKTGVLALACGLSVCLADGTLAQEGSEPAAAPATAGENALEGQVSSEDIDALIQRVEEQIQRMNAASSERDNALEFLKEQIDKATSQITAKEETEEALRQKTIELGSEIEILSQDRSSLSDQAETQEATLARLTDEVAKLTTKIAELELLRQDEQAQWTAQLQAEQAALAQAQTALTANQTDLSEAQNARAAEQAELIELRTQLAARETALQQAQSTIAGLRQSASVQVSERDQALQTANSQIDELTQQVSVLVQKLTSVQAALSLSETTINEQSGTISELNEQLTVALQAQVEELEQYRSDFFGQLRKILGSSQDIKVVGDRFVLPASLFFASGSSLLSPQAQQQLGQVASQLSAITAKIPSDIHWILRVDGHTDNEPLKEGSFFQSNWELSSARAISVVKFLIEAGVDPARLAATGFGEFQPIDPINKAPNRRIEFKLTEG